MIAGSLSVGMAVGFLGTVAMIAGLIPVSHRIGLVDLPDARKAHAVATPLVGGIALFVAVAGALAITGNAPTPLGPFLAGAAMLVVFGLFDDVRDLDYRVRFAVQGIAALILVLYGGARVETLGDLFGDGPVNLGPLAVPFSVFAIVGMINAMNMLDGVDGLAGSVTVAILAPVAAFGAITGSTATLVPALILISGVVGFLLFNFRFPWCCRARVFMGDAGSNFLGYCLAWFVITLPHDPAASVAPIDALWLIGLPVADTLATMWRRIRKRQSPFQAGHDHAHHVLQRAGLGVNATVLAMAFLGAACALFGLASASRHWLPQPLLTYGFVALVVVHHLLLSHAWRVSKLIRRVRTLVGYGPYNRPEHPGQRDAPPTKGSLVRGLLSPRRD